MTTSTLRASVERRVVTLEERREQQRRHPVAWIVLGAIGLGALVIMVPFLLMLLNAFKTDGDYANNGPLSWPTHFEFNNVITYIQTVNFGQKLLNSIVMSLSISIGAVLLSLVSAYAIGVGRVRGRAWVLALFIVANILPQEALIYPLFAEAQAVNLGDSLIPVIIIVAVLNASFGTYLLSSVLGTFPRALLEAAQVDGAGRWRILWTVVVPVIRPTLTVLFVFIFIWSWNEFFIPILFLTNADTQTVPIALASLQGDKFLNPTMTAAGSLVSMIPTLALFLIFQRSLVRGVTVGAVK